MGLRKVDPSLLMFTTCAQLTLTVPHDFAHYMPMYIIRICSLLFFFCLTLQFLQLYYDIFWTFVLIISKMLEQIQMYYFSISSFYVSFYVFLVNSSRGNKYFGDCTALMTPRCLIPANREAGADTATDANTWRPPSEVSFASSLLFISVVS